MEITRRLYETLRDTYELEGITENYSGRFMYGRNCFGFTCEPGEFYSALFDIVDSGEFDEELQDEARGFFIAQPSMSSDSLGLGRICYFMGVSVEEDAQDESEEEDE